VAKSAVKILISNGTITGWTLGNGTSNKITSNSTQGNG
jgi:hypothetical protein